MTGLRTRRSVICSCQKKGWERIENNHWAFGIPLQGYLFELIKHNLIQFIGIIEIQEELFRSKDERCETLRFCCGIFPQQISFWSAQKHRWFHQQNLREAGNPPALDSQDRYDTAVLVDLQKWAPTWVWNRHDSARMVLVSFRYLCATSKISNEWPKEIQLD